MLDDLTSGFNITKNLTLGLEYNEMLGVTRDELADVIKSLQIDKRFNMAELIRDMETYYNGYLFSKNGNERLYNTNMVLYFLDSLNRDKKYPDNILDLNIKTDYKKIESMAFNFKDEGLVQKLLTEGEVETGLAERFNLEYMYDKKENFASILYYTGMLTIKSALPETYVLKIPNYVIRTIYWEYFLDKLLYGKKIDIRNEILAKAVNEMAATGKIQGIHAYLNEFMETLSNMDLISFDEKYIKMVLMAVFHQSGYYIVNSEYEVEDGYIDIFLTKNKAYASYIKYEWIIELKYLKESDRDRLETVKNEAVNQVNLYKESNKLKNGFLWNNINKLILVFVGKKDVYTQIV